MIRRILIIITISAFIVTSVFVTQIAQAQSNSDITTARCQQATTRIATRLERIDTVRGNRETAHARLQGRLGEIVSRAEANGYDTVRMVAAQTSLQSAIAGFDEALQAYDDSLTALSQIDCTATTRDFLTGLTASRSDLREVRTSSITVRTTINDTVLPALREYASWIRQQTTSQENQ